MSTPLYKKIDKMIKSWDLNNSIKDKDLLNDIESLATEAYMQGAFDSSKDKELLEEATGFVEKL